MAARDRLQLPPSARIGGAIVIAARSLKVAERSRRAIRVEVGPLAVGVGPAGEPKCLKLRKESGRPRVADPERFGELLGIDETEARPRIENRRSKPEAHAC